MPHYSSPIAERYQGKHTGLAEPAPMNQNVLRVMTMNIGHGRGNGFHQLTQSTTEIVANIDRIVALLDTEAPDIVAFQEIDAPSFWSGNFNHVDYFGERHGFCSSVRASHVEFMGLSYGTALLSRYGLADSLAATFYPPLTTVPTGFVLATFSPPGRPELEIDVVSAHLDFLSEAIRAKQVDQLIARLRARNHSVIIMGDLNAVWSRRGSTVQYLIDELGLKAYQADNVDLVTFPALGRRLDWILVSADLGFSSYRVVGNGLSDHNGVLAELTLPAL